MSTLKVTAIQDTSGGNTTTINSMTPTADSLQGFRNRIINGDMRIDQRNAGASVSVQTTTGYTLDRWTTLTAANSKYTVQQNGGSVTPPAGYTNYLGFTVGASANVTVGATDQYVIRQLIEGFNVADLAFGTASAKTITVSFWVRSSVTGTFGGALVNNAGDRSYPFSYSISSANTWEQKTITVAGDTTGTWVTNSGNGLNLCFSLGVGSTYSGTAGSWAATYYASATSAVKLVETNSATWYITGVQLEVGSVATPFERRPYGTELMLCQRYFQVLSGGVVGVSASATAFNGTIVYPVTMRAAPSSSVSAAYRISDITSSSYTQSSGNVTNSLVLADSGFFQFGNFTGMTTGRFALGANSSSGNLLLSSEL